jgi:hypothetical protein
MKNGPRKNWKSAISLLHALFFHRYTLERAWKRTLAVSDLKLCIRRKILFAKFQAKTAVNLKVGVGILLVFLAVYFNINLPRTRREAANNAREQRRLKNMLICEVCCPHRKQDDCEGLSGQVPHL